MLNLFLAFSALVAWLGGSPPSSPPSQDEVAVHEVEFGDTLTAIANEYGVEVERLWAANDGIEDPHMIHVGQELVIPGESRELDVQPLPHWQPYLPPALAPSASPRSSTPAPSPSRSGIPWDDLAECESNQRWDIDAHAHRGGPYHDARFYGGLQFNKMSWDWAVEVGGHDVPYWPHHATREQQIAVAETLLRIHPAGIRAWPACAEKLGLG